MVKGTLINCSDTVNEYINREDWRIKGNANTGYSGAGLINNIAGKVVANWWLDEVYTKDEGDAHRNADYHIHDLDILGGYCIGHDLQKLLQEGFNGVVSRVGAKPPKHFREALYQMANYIGILQAEWAGAQAFSSFDTLLAPYVFYDMNIEGLDERDVKKAIINFVYNLNVPSRWGQSPFSNLTIDWTVPPSLKDLVPMYNDTPYFVKVFNDSIKENYEKMIKCRGMFGPGDSKEIEFIDKIRERLNDYESDEETLMYSLTYKHFQKEMDIINRCFYQVLTEGDKDGQPFTFPIPTVNITEDFDWDNPNCKYLFENTAKYGHSYFQNFIGSQYLRDENGKLTIKDPNAYSPNDVRSMCCRLQLDKKALRKRGGGLFGSDAQTGCYDDETEVLTQNGWKFFKDISFADKVYTLSDNRQIEVHSPINIFKYEYDGKLCHFKTDSLDLRVTPNHRMLLTHNSNDKFRFKEAKDCNHHCIIPVRGYWSGSDIKYHILKPIPSVRNNTKSYGETKIKMETWLKFLGLFISEGSVRGSKGGKAESKFKYEIVISQSKPQNIALIDEVMSDLPFNISKTICNNGAVYWTISNKQLWMELKELGNSYNKHIPGYVFGLSPNLLRILFDYLLLGDGHIRKDNGHKEYYTSSKRLKDDMQQLALLLGMGSSVFKVNPQTKNCYIKGRKINSTNINYTISFHIAKNRGVSGYTSEDYNGFVYCLEVPNNTLFVRRNGKTAWCGNSIGVVTINMARLGYLFKGDMVGLKNRLKELCDMASSTLEKKRKIVQKYNDEGLYPYTRRYVKTLDTFFSTIGVNGMNEMVRNFTNDKYNITDMRGQQMAKDILDYINELILGYQETTGTLYNLEGVPAEGTTYRFAKEDIKRFPDIIQAGYPEAPYYTNSSQLPVDFSDDPFAVLDLQDELQKKYTGGTVLHLYMTERISTPEACKQLVKKVLSNYRLPYISITPSFSVCPKHGYIAGAHDFCPLCDKEIMARHAKEVDLNT